MKQNRNIWTLDIVGAVLPLLIELFQSDFDGFAVSLSRSGFAGQLGLFESTVS
jgi:hypothetical protein